MKRRMQVTIGGDTYEALRKLAFERRVRIQDVVIDAVESAVTIKPAAAARPAGRDAKRHEAEGARAAKADADVTTTLLPSDMRPATADSLGRCRVCRNPNLPYGSDVCLQCSRESRT